jgi:hypothetical protein
MNALANRTSPVITHTGWRIDPRRSTAEVRVRLHGPQTVKADSVGQRKVSSSPERAEARVCSVTPAPSHQRFLSLITTNDVAARRNLPLSFRCGGRLNKRSK